MAGVFVVVLVVIGNQLSIIGGRGSGRDWQRGMGEGAAGAAAEAEADRCNSIRTKPYSLSSG